MNRILKSLMLVTASMTVFSACNKVDTDESIVKNETRFIIRGHLDEDSRTFIENDGKTYSPKWSKGDKVGVFFGDITSGTTANANFENKAEDGDVATFEGTYSNAGDEGSIKAVYPADAIYQGYNDGTLGMTVKDEQSPSATSFDAEADILVSQSCNYTKNSDSDGAIEVDDMYFSRVMSVVRINLKSDYDAVKGLAVKTLKLSAGSGDVLTGRAKVDLSTRTVTGWTLSNNYVSAKYDDGKVSIASENNSVYLVVNPTTIASGTSITFDITTDAYTISKTIELTKDLAFPQGNIAVINLTVKEEDCTEVEEEKDYTGDWVIYGVNNVAKKYESGNNCAAISVTLSDNGLITFTSTDDRNNAKMHIEKASDETYKGLYTICDAGGNYLYAAATGSGKNFLKGSTDLTAASYWKITENSDGSFSIIADKVNSSYARTIRYNSNSNVFACYISGQNAVYLYYFPKEIFVESDEISASAVGATDASFTFSTDGIDDSAEITATSDGDFISDVKVDGKSVTYTVSPNYTASSRAGKITLSLADDASVTKDVVISQAGSVLSVSTTEVTIPEDGDDGTFYVTSDVFAGKVVSDNENLLVDDSFEATGSGNKEITILWDGEATDQEQLLATLKVYRTADDPQARTVKVYKAAKGVAQLATPSNVSVSDVSESGFSATWDEVANAKGYSYKLTSSSSADADAVVGGDVSENSATVSGLTLTAGATYYLFVKAIGDTSTYKDSAWSDAVQLNIPQPKTEQLIHTFIASGMATGYGTPRTGVSGSGTNNGMTWTVTSGGGDYIGTNKNGISKCYLTDTYAKVGAPMGYAASTAQVVAVISESTMSNVCKVVVTGDSDKNPTTASEIKISLVYSEDGVTYSQVGATVDYNARGTDTNEFTIDAVKESGYYAIVLYYSSTSAYMRTKGLTIKYYGLQ